MLKIDSATPSTNNKTLKRAAILAGTGAVAGGGATYYLQKRAIAKAKAAKEAAANRNIFQKTIGLVKTGIAKAWGGIKTVAGKAKTSYQKGMDNVAKSGKISKMGIAKGAIITAIALPTIAYLKDKLTSSKPHDIAEVKNDSEEPNIK